MRPPIIDGVMTYLDADGLVLREVCAETAAGKREYERRLGVLVLRQLGRCAICLKYMQKPVFDHASGRGFSGSHRGDRCWDEDGNPKNASLCDPCNGLKGSRRYEWKDGAYVPVERAA